MTFGYYEIAFFVKNHVFICDGDVDWAWKPVSQADGADALAGKQITTITR